MGERYAPAVAEKHIYAEWLGVDPEDTSCAVAQSGLTDVLPDGWVACQLSPDERRDNDGGLLVYYHSAETGTSTWTHPSDENHLALVSAHKAAKLTEGLEQASADYVWSSRDPRSGTWVPYTDSVSCHLEAEYLTGVPSTVVTIGSKKFTVSFTSWRQYNNVKGSRPVSRHGIGKPPSLKPLASSLRDKKKKKNAASPSRAAASADRATPNPSVTTNAPTRQSVYDASSRSKAIPVPQSLHQHSPDLQREELPVPGTRGFVVHNLLSQVESAHYLSHAEIIGFHDSDVAREFPDAVRNNERFVHISDELADCLWRRLQPTIKHRDLYRITPIGYGAEGRWTPCGVNPCFRVSRYSQGQQFARHLDGMYTPSEDRASIYSIVIYLNENFDGGALQFHSGDGEAVVHSFEPLTGSAVLFLHDTWHSAQPVLAGGPKYILRSELMFERVDTRPLPVKPQPILDPHWQRMAALYAQVGDLAIAGDAAATTSTYQEALGIQVAHHGSLDDCGGPRLVLFAHDVLAMVAAFLTLPEIGQLGLTCRSWGEGTQAGFLWRGLYQRRWPNCFEVVDDMTRNLDASLKDWVNMYRRRHITERGSPVVAILVDQMVHCRLIGRRDVVPVPARATHEESGIGWDHSLRQRRGWTVGKNGEHSWVSERDREVRWGILSELWAYCFFGALCLRPSEHRVILVTVPGFWTEAHTPRALRILTGRFQVQGVCLAPAPLLALFAAGLTSGIVVSCNSIASGGFVTCYGEGKALGQLGPFDPKSVSVRDIASQIIDAARQYCGSDKPRDIIFSVQGERYAWIDAPALESILRAEYTGDASVRPPLHRDIMLGADALAASPEFPTLCQAPPPRKQYVWRYLDPATNRWVRFRRYHCAVLETAYQRGIPSVSIPVREDPLYTVVDFRKWQCHDLSFGEIQPGSKRKVTRHPEGQPSTVPVTTKNTEEQRPPEITKLYGSAILDPLEEEIAEDIPGEPSDFPEAHGYMEPIWDHPVPADYDDEDEADAPREVEYFDGEDGPNGNDGYSDVHAFVNRYLNTNWHHGGLKIFQTLDRAGIVQVAQLRDMTYDYFLRLFPGEPTVKYDWDEEEKQWQDPAFRRADLVRAVARYYSDYHDERIALAKDRRARAHVKFYFSNGLDSDDEEEEEDNVE